SRLEQEHDNLRAAVEWFARAGEAEKGLRLGAALWRFWAERGYLTEGRERLARLLALPGAAIPKAVQLKALYAAGVLADAQGDYRAARSFFEETLAINRQSGDSEDTVFSLHSVGNVAVMQGDYAAARSIYEDALKISRQLGNGIEIAW